jgi:hypothetical protein
MPKSKKRGGEKAHRKRIDERNKKIKEASIKITEEFNRLLKEAQKNR